MPVIQGLLSIPGAIAKALGTALYAIFVTAPYAVFTTMSSVLAYMAAAVVSGLSFLVTIPGIVFRGVVSVFSGALSLANAGLTSITAILAPYAALVLSSIVSAFNAYITYMNALNVRLASFFAPLARFFAPLVARVPWLANVARFLQPLARFAPVFKVLQGALILASVPYVTAAVAGVAVAGYAAISRLFANVNKSLNDYFFESRHLPSVRYQFRRYRFFTAIARAPFVAAARLAIVIIQATVINTIDSLSTGRSAFRATYAAVLDLPIFQIMRSAWKGFSTTARSVSNAQILSYLQFNNSRIHEISHAIGFQASHSVLRSGRQEIVPPVSTVMQDAYAKLRTLEQKITALEGKQFAVGFDADTKKKIEELIAQASIGTVALKDVEALADRISALELRNTTRPEFLPASSLAASAAPSLETSTDDDQHQEESHATDFAQNPNSSMRSSRAFMRGGV